MSVRALVTVVIGVVAFVVIDQLITSVITGTDTGSTLLQTVVRIVVAAAGFLTVFLGINAVFFLAAPNELRTETHVTGSGASVGVYAGPTAEAALSSPLTVLILVAATMLIIAWMIWSNKEASRMGSEAGSSKSGAQSANTGQRS